MDELPEASWVNGGSRLPQAYAQRYRYDRFGNRTLNTVATWGIGINRKAFAVEGATNRLGVPAGQSGVMSYDPAGNLIKDTYTQAGTTGNRTYDAENRMLAADGGNGLANSYAYDADGHRTRRSLNNGGEIWWQVYGISGELVGEYQLVSGTPTLKKEYGYRNGQLLVIAESAGTCQWLMTDALGTPRMIADQTGSLSAMKRRDYLPFGEEILAGIGHRQTTNGYSGPVSTSPRQQFTSKERDNETGLDYFEARYYGSVHGRFISPDEFTGGPDKLFDFAEDASDNPTFYADLTDPQSLNKYQYCYNNPLSYVDPDGHNPKTFAYWGLKQVLIGIGKSVANVVIGAGNAGAVVTGDQPTAPYEPGNSIQERTMRTTDKLLVLGSLLGGKGPANVMVAETKQTAVVAAEVASETKIAATQPYKRPPGATTAEQRASVQGQECATCGAKNDKMFAGHKKALVQEHYETGTIDKKRMRSVDAVRPECPTCSAREGAEMSRYSQAMKKKLPESEHK